MSGQSLITKFRLIAIAMLIAASGTAAFAQKVAVKTNLLGDALLNPNAGIELGVAPRWTVDVPASFNLWNLSHDRRWKHWMVQPGVRYWLCNRFAGHFFGAHLHGGQYNIGGFDGKWNFLGTDARKLKDTRYQGWFVGGGISYGYAFILDKHWNLEGEIGIGYSYTRFDSYPCAHCGNKLDSNKSHNYVGPTKAAVNIVYLF